MGTVDESSGYYRNEPSFAAHRTQVTRGTPMGELLRRYWIPIGPSSYATTLPKKVRALGEDLILFRNTAGRAGLVHSRCCHRGSSLFYGRVEEDGIRCCYHGWKFDPEGRVLERPAEPNPGPISSVRQPWYPVEERYGLIFAYMGPAAKKPLLPRYNILEEFDPGDQLWVDDHNIGSGDWSDEPVPNNFLQRLENSQDPAHFFWLHYLHSGPQFGDRFGEIDLEKLKQKLPNVDKETHYEFHDFGIWTQREDRLPSGGRVKTITEFVMPTFRVTPNPFGKAGRSNEIAFMLPVDDTSYRIFTVLRAPDRKYLDFMDTLRVKRPAEQSQRFPNDYEAIVSQGPVTLHSEEHLGVSDRGVVNLRKMLEEQLQAVAEGRDPIGVRFTAGTELVHLRAGSFLHDPVPSST